MAMLSEKKTNVINAIVNHNLCIGCGLCVTACYRNNLCIRFDNRGQYSPEYRGQKCGESCSRCLDVCPFYKENEDTGSIASKLFSAIDGIQYKEECGFYISAYAGFSKVDHHRENGASGGMATWTLEKLLSEGYVDKILCVSPNASPDMLFKYIVCDTIERVRSCSGSCYYPVQASDVLNYVMENEGRYAIVCLPCFAKALRLAQKITPNLRTRIFFVLGLVCGQGKTKFYTDFICLDNNINPAQVIEINYRQKNPKYSARFRGIKCKTKLDNGKIAEKTFYLTNQRPDIWASRFFTPNPCNFCDDTFAETADAVFLDAWLPEFDHDYRGTSIVLVRNVFLNSMILKWIHNLELKKIDIVSVIRSQRALVFHKRNITNIRKKIAIKYNYEIPFIRKPISNCKVGIIESYIAKLKYNNSLKSPSVWISCQGNVKKFKTIFWMSIFKEAFLRKLNRFFNKIFFWHKI